MAVKYQTMVSSMFMYAPADDAEVEKNFFVKRLAGESGNKKKKN